MDTTEGEKYLARARKVAKERQSKPKTETKKGYQWSEKKSYAERKARVETLKKGLIDMFGQCEYEKMMLTAGDIVLFRHELKEEILEFLGLKTSTKKELAAFKKNKGFLPKKESAKLEKIIDRHQKWFLEVAVWEWQKAEQAKRQKAYRERKQEKSGLPKRPRGRPRKTDT